MEVVAQAALDGAGHCGFWAPFTRRHHPILLTVRKHSIEALHLQYYSVLACRRRWV